MSLPEQGAKVATSAIDAFRSQPIMLAVLILNGIIFLAIFYAVQTNRAAQQEVMKAVLEQNAKAQELLARCVVPRTGINTRDWVPLSNKSPVFLPPKEPPK